MHETQMGYRRQQPEGGSAGIPSWQMMSVSLSEGLFLSRLEFFLTAFIVVHALSADLPPHNYGDR